MFQSRLVTSLMHSCTDHVLPGVVAGAVPVPEAGPGGQGQEDREGEVPSHHQASR